MRDEAHASDSESSEGSGEESEEMSDAEEEDDFPDGREKERAETTQNVHFWFNGRGF